MPADGSAGPHLAGGWHRSRRATSWRCLNSRLSRTGCTWMSPSAATARFRSKRRQRVDAGAPA